MANEKRYAKGIAITAALVVLAASGFVAEEYWANRTVSPHYVDEACTVCHGEDTRLKANEIELCTSCHGREGETYVKNEEDVLIKIDLGRSHPWGVVAVPGKNFPTTLPLYEWELIDGKLVNGKVYCSTCHDVHTDNEDSRMLRLGDDEDFTPLCADCHSEKV